MHIPPVASCISNGYKIAIGLVKNCEVSVESVTTSSLYAQTSQLGWNHIARSLYYLQHFVIICDFQETIDWFLLL